MSDFVRYIVPNGGGVADHPSGLLYRREDVDPVVNALRARIRELEAELADAVNALYAVELEYDPSEDGQNALIMYGIASDTMDAIRARSNKDQTNE